MVLVHFVHFIYSLCKCLNYVIGIQYDDVSNIQFMCWNMLNLLYLLSGGHRYVSDAHRFSTKGHVTWPRSQSDS